MFSIRKIPAGNSFSWILILLFVIGTSLGNTFAQAPEEANTATSLRVDTVQVPEVNFYPDFAELLLLFKKADIHVINNSKIKKKDKLLKEIKFQLMHPQGLNFKLRITDFSQLEFHFAFDENQQCQYFTFRINGEEVYQQISLDTEGFKSYDCFPDGQIVQRGETNHKIEKYH